MDYQQRKQIYNDNFSLGYLNVAIEKKFVLIGLICYLTYKAKLSKPGSNCYQIIQALNKKSFVPDEFVENLSIICDDYMYGCSEFTTFGIKKTDIIPTIESILHEYLPF